MAFERVCTLDDLWQGEMEVFDVNGVDVLVIHTSDGKVVATQSVCPHQEFCLGDGEFDGSTLTCQKHLWQFDAATGKGINPAHAELAIYPSKVEGEDVYVDTVGVEPKFAHS